MSKRSDYIDECDLLYQEIVVQHDKGNVTLFHKRMMRQLFQMVEDSMSVTALENNMSLVRRLHRELTTCKWCKQVKGEEQYECDGSDDEYHSFD